MTRIRLINADKTNECTVHRLFKSCLNPSNPCHLYEPVGFLGCQLKRDSFKLVAGNAKPPLGECLQLSILPSRGSAFPVICNVPRLKLVAVFLLKFFPFVTGMLHDRFRFDRFRSKRRRCFLRRSRMKRTAFRQVFARRVAFYFELRYRGR